MVDFEMFTDEGNQACTDALQRIHNLIYGDKFITESEFKAFVKEQIHQVSLVHPEVYDTEPEVCFDIRINLALERRGYRYKVNRFDFHS